MSGLRQTRARLQQCDLEPLVREARAQRSVTHMRLRYAQATDWVGRLAAAAEHVRSVARTSSRVDQLRTDEVLRELTARLLADAGELLELGKAAQR